MSQVESFPHLVTLLDAHRDNILTVWVERTRSLPDCHYCQQSYEQVRAWIADDWGVVTDALRTGSFGQLEAHLTDVSLKRLSLGFDIGEVAQALLLCKEIVLPFIRGLGLSVGQEETAILQLDACLRYMVGCFAHLYADGMNRSLREQQQRLEQLAIVEERQRLARELHDSVSQSLYTVTLYADAATMALDAHQLDVTAGYLRNLRSTAQEAMRDMRLLVFELHPPELEHEGLVAALQARLAAVETRAGLQAEFLVEDERSLPLAVEKGLYRIAQEVLNNVVRHAQARRVSLRLSFTDALVCLDVRDDGIGFDQNVARKSGGMGLRNIEERVAQLGGSFVLESAPGQGTHMRVELAAAARSSAPGA